MQHGDVRAQEEGLKQMKAVVDALDYEEMKRRVLPATYELCLATTSAAVRVAAFRALAASAARTGQAEAEAMLAVAAQVVAVDKSAPTAMCVLGLGEALARQWGARLAAERVLPALTPLLVMPALSAAQFVTALKTIKEVLAEVERSRTGHSGDANGGSAQTGSAPPGGSSADDAIGWMAGSSSESSVAGHSTATPMRAPAAPSAALRPPLDLSGLSLKATNSPSKRAAFLSSTNNNWMGQDTAFVSAPVAAAPLAALGVHVPRPPGMRRMPMRAADPFADLQVHPAPPPLRAAAPTLADPFDSLVLLHGAPHRSGGSGPPAAPSLL
jgi:SCY1-like protein 2